MLREITSLQHPLVKHLVRLRQNRDYRDEHQSVVIEGAKLIQEVCSHHHTKMILVCDESLIPSGIKTDDTVLVNEDIMHKISAVKSPEGIIAEVALPKNASLHGKRYILACDGISDPGNMGTLIRTALALGWDGAFLLNNCCDPYNDKAIRAAKGATFRLPIGAGSWKELKELAQNNQLKPLLADISGISINQYAAQDSLLLVLGNEAHGASEETQKLCEKIKIPMPGEMESLNVAVAGGILMYHLKTKGLVRG
jgi:RNA methyltransferase, TrmH family